MKTDKKIVYNTDADTVKKGLVMTSKEKVKFYMYGTLIDYNKVNTLVGQLLTCVDATYSDVEQRNAHKSIIRNIIREWYYNNERMMPVKGGEPNVSDNMPVTLDAKRMVFEYWDREEMTTERTPVEGRIN